MKNKLSSLIVLTLASVLLFALPTLADIKPASPQNTSSDQNSPGHSSSGDPHGASSLPEVIVAKDGKFQVHVQADPEKPAPKKPVTIMITVINEATGQPVLDASVNFEMMLMEKGSHGNMAGMSMDPATTLKGQAMLDNMEPGMYAITLTPMKQGEWIQDIHISSPSLGETTVTLPLNISKSGANWILIGSVGGFVVLAGIFAQFLKREQNDSEEI